MTRRFAEDSFVYAPAVKAILTVAEQQGMARDALLRAHNISEKQVAEADGRIPLAAYYALYRDVCERTGQPDLALAVGRVTYLAGMHLQLYMATVCGNLRDYLNLIPSILILRGDVGEVKASADGDYLRLDWCPLYAETALDRYLSDDVLCASALIVGSLCVLPVPVLKATFTYPEPMDLTELVRCFGPDLEFGAEVSSLYYDRKALSLPLVGQDFRADMTPETYSALIGTTAKHDSLLATIKALILRKLPFGEVSVEDMASSLNMSRRTLQRRLRSRNTSFTALLQDTRYHQARKYLHDDRLSIIQISLLLGYADQSAFTSAFTLWHGMPPSAYRTQLKYGA